MSHTSHKKKRQNKKGEWRWFCSKCKTCSLNTKKGVGEEARGHSHLKTYMALYFKALTTFLLISFPSSRGIWAANSPFPQHKRPLSQPLQTRDERALQSKDLFIFPHVATIKRFPFRLRFLSIKVRNCSDVKKPYARWFFKTGEMLLCWSKFSLKQQEGSLAHLHASHVAALQRENETPSPP